MIKITTGYSTLLPVKNIAGVIRAVAKLKGIDYQLNIVGDGPEREKLKTLVKELKIVERVKFFDQVPNQKARGILRQSDIFILNSTHEGMPHALLEALAEKVPVIATRIPAVTEILTDKINGLLVNVDDPDDLAKKIVEIKRYPLLSENGRKLFHKKFTWKAHLKKLVEVFGK